MKRSVIWKAVGIGAGYCVCLWVSSGGALHAAPDVSDNSGLTAPEQSGPEEHDWGLDTGPNPEKATDSTGSTGGADTKKNSGTDSTITSQPPDAIQQHVARQYVEFRTQRLNANRKLRPELIRAFDARLAKAYAAAMVPRSSLARARGRIEAGFEELLLKINRHVKSKQVILGATIQKMNGDGGQGNVLLNGAEPDAAPDVVFFVYRVRPDGGFESDVTFAPGR